MACKLCNKKPKKIPYGQKRKLHWCNCDRGHIAPVNKRFAREEGKKEIKKQYENVPTS